MDGFSGPVNGNVVSPNDAAPGFGGLGPDGNPGFPGMNPADGAGFNPGPGYAGYPGQPGAGGQPGDMMVDQPPKTTLWMGELDANVNEDFIRNLWKEVADQTVQVKLLRDKVSGGAYCFVDFQSPEAATKALELNGTPIPGSNSQFKLNWALGGGLSDQRNNRTPEYSIFVGDLAPEITDYHLLRMFQANYKSCKSAKVMSDPRNGQSRGYGFVRFLELNDQQRALSEMNGVYCGDRPMRVSNATPKRAKFGDNNGGPGFPMVGHPSAPPMWNGPMNMYGNGAPINQSPMNQFTDPNNTTVFVGGLSGYVSEDELRSFFQGFGEINYVKIPPGKGCGFVQFVQRHAAEMAINQMQGYPIGNSRVRLSWGRSQNNADASKMYRPAQPNVPYDMAGGYGYGLPPFGGAAPQGVPPMPPRPFPGSQ